MGGGGVTVKGRHEQTTIVLVHYLIGGAFDNTYHSTTIKIIKF